MRKTTLREIKMLRTLQQDNIVKLLEAFKRKKKMVGRHLHTQQRQLTQMHWRAVAGPKLDLTVSVDEQPPAVQWRTITCITLVPRWSHAMHAGCPSAAVEAVSNDVADSKEPPSSWCWCMSTCRHACILKDAWKMPCAAQLQ